MHCRAAFAAFCVLVLAAPAAARGCDNRTAAARLAVPPGRIAEALAAPDGAVFAATLRDRELWLDVTHYPARLRSGAALHAILTAGRLTDDSFETVVLADGPLGVLSIGTSELQAVACSYRGDADGTANPIDLLGRLFGATTRYGSDMPLVPAGAGGAGDLALSLALVTEVLMPEWVYGALR